jgi:hypothetical protein
MHDVELPHRGVFYPAGFPLRLATNSRDVLEAADESWRYWQREYDVEPLRFRVVAEPEGELAGPPVFRICEHMVQVVSDRHNFAGADLRALTVSIHVSAATASDHPWLRWFFVESMAYMLLVQRYLVWRIRRRQEHVELRVRASRLDVCGRRLHVAAGGIAGSHRDRPAAPDPTALRCAATFSGTGGRGGAHAS